MSLLAIGCGAEWRGDDTAGLLAARALRRLGFDACEHTGDGAALIELWTGRPRVILIDAVVTGAEPGAIQRWDGRVAPVLRTGFRSAHAFGVAEGLELARVLRRLPEELAIYGIEGKRFDPGSGLTPPVASAVETLVHRIAKEFAGCLKPPPPKPVPNDCA